MKYITELLTKKLDKVDNLKDLENLRLEYLGKKGLISLEMQKMAKLDPQERKNFGQEINQVKQESTKQIESKFRFLSKEAMNHKLQEERQDLTMPAREVRVGGVHPITQARQELLEIFVRMGFAIKSGPSIEDDWHNFTALNIPEHHPARQDHDTFYLPGNKLLRTHTSPVQIRAMMDNKPPFRFVAPGRTYRCDSDATHTPMFHQIEVLMIDENTNIGHLKYFLQEFIRLFFEREDIVMRLRSSFFPFTEPSIEVDIKMNESDKWLEILGCGMVHPKVLEHVNIGKNYQGFAVGMGIERLAMLKYGINDLRRMYDGDNRWAEKYNFSAFDIPSFIGGLTK